MTRFHVVFQKARKNRLDKCVTLCVTGVKIEHITRNLWRNVIAEIINYPFCLSSNARTKTIFRHRKKPWIDESPFTLFSTSGWLHVCHAWREIHSPKCSFPTVRASVGAAVVSSPSVVCLHSVAWQAGKCQTSTAFVRAITFLVFCCFSPDDWTI